MYSYRLSWLVNICIKKYIFIYIYIYYIKKSKDILAKYDQDNRERS